MKLKFIGRIAVVIFFVSLAPVSSAQQIAIDTSEFPVWVKMMNDPDANFYQTQRAFNLYWQNRKITPGCGYKPFKRWEYSVRNFVNEEGFIQPFNVQKDAYVAWQNKQAIKSVKRAAGPCPNGFWKELGPTVEEGHGRINAIAFHPNDSNIIYCGAPAGGLWRTTDRGKLWVPLTDNMPTLGVSAIVVDSKNPNIIYIGTGDRDGRDAGEKGVFKSTDAGKTFVSMSNGMGDKLIVKLIIDPNNSLTLIAATNRGIYRTKDGGLNWTLSDGTWEYKDLDYMPGNFKNVYASAAGDFYLSQDSGKSFVKVALNVSMSYGARGAIGVSPVNPKLVYFVITGYANFAYLMLSRDGGKTFVQKSSSPNIMGKDPQGLDNTGQAYYDLDIAVNPLNAADVFVGGINIFRSLDSGKTWKIDVNTDGLDGSFVIHSDQHVMEFSPLTMSLYVGNDGGFYEKKRKGGLYSNQSYGLGIGQVYRVSVGNTPNTILNGFQDNGTKVYSGKQTFEKIGSGDGMDNTYDMTNVNHCYLSLQNGLIMRSGFDNVKGIGIVSSPITEIGGWVTPFILKEGDNHTMIAGYQSLFISKNIDTTNVADITWSQKTFAGNFAPYIYKIENSPVNNSILFYSDDKKGLFKTTDLKSNYPTWTDMTSLLPATGVVEAIECDYFNAGNLYIAQGARVYKSVNGAKNWTDISNGLPNVNVYCLVMDSSKTNESIYAGTYAGVYYKNNTMSAWVPFNNRLPQAAWVRDLAISYVGKSPAYKLVAGTYGRGIWESPLYNLGSRKPIANFEPEKIAACPGATLKMFDASAYVGDLTWKILNVDGAEFTDYTDGKTTVPHVRFTKPGLYYIQLNVSNCNGEDSVVKRIIVYDELKPTTCNIKATNTLFGVTNGIRNVWLNKLYNSTGSTYSGGANEDFTCMDLQVLNRDSIYPLIVRTYNSTGEYCKAYIDFNNNGILTDAGEEIMNSGKVIDHVGQFTIPRNAITNTKLRVRIIANSDSITGPCMNTKYGQSEDYAIIIKVENDFSNGQSVVCINTPTVFTEKSIEPYVKYLWNFGSDATPAAANTKGPHSVVYSKVGKKTVQLTINDTIVLKRIDYVNVVAQAKSKFTIKKTANLAYTFTPDILTYESYLWTFGDGIGNSKNVKPSYAYAAGGTYPVKLVTGLSHCPDSSVQTITAAGLQSLNVNELDVKIIPNPNSGKFRLELDLQGSKELSYRVEDYLGRVIAGETKFSYEQGRDLLIDISNINPGAGIYFLNLMTVNGNFKYKLIIE